MLHVSPCNSAAPAFESPNPWCCVPELYLYPVHMHTECPRACSDQKFPLLEMTLSLQRRSCHLPPQKKRVLDHSLSRQGFDVHPRQPPPDAFRAKTHPAAPFSQRDRLTAAPELPRLGLATTRQNLLRYLRHMHHSYEAGLHLSLSMGLGAAHQLLRRADFAFGQTW